MTTKTKVILAIVAVNALATAFAFGRYTAPEKIVKEVETKVVEVIKEVKVESGKTDTSRNKRVEKVVTETVYPDGRKVTETRTIETTETERKTEKEVTEGKETERETESKSTETIKYARNAWTLSVLGGVDRNQVGLIYGAHAQKEILGPINGGLWGLSSGVFGVSLGLQF